MEAVAQLVRASDCGSEGRGFETLQPPLMPLIQRIKDEVLKAFLCLQVREWVMELGLEVVGYNLLL